MKDVNPEATQSPKSEASLYSLTLQPFHGLQGRQEDLMDALAGTGGPCSGMTGRFSIYRAWCI